MNTLVRNTTLRFSRRVDGYEPLDHSRKTTGEDGGGRRTLSRRKISSETENHPVTIPLSYKRDRARKRQIFLKTYTLTSSSINSSGKSRSRKLKKAAIKVKSVIFSVMSFMRASSLRSCNSGSSNYASSPSPIRRRF